MINNASHKHLLFYALLLVIYQQNIMLLCAFKIMPASLMLSNNSPKPEMGHGLIRIIYSLVLYAFQQCIIPCMLAKLAHYVFKVGSQFLLRYLIYTYCSIHIVIYIYIYIYIPNKQKAFVFFMMVFIDKYIILGCIP